MYVSLQLSKTLVAQYKTPVTHFLAASEVPLLEIIFRYPLIHRPLATLSTAQLGKDHKVFYMITSV